MFCVVYSNNLANIDESFMGPKPTEIQTDELFLMRLDGQLKMSHPLIKLANTLDWSALEKEFAGYFVSTRGRPALPQRIGSRAFVSAACL